MTYERAFFSSAGREKFSVPTLFLERKIMSTKTTIKRISAVAALALALGGLTSVAANATGASDWRITNYAATNADTPTGSGSNAETATQTAGVANYVTLTNINVKPVYYTISGGATTSGATSGTAETATAVKIATPAAGTITVTSYEITAGAAATTATSTTTITVLAYVAAATYSSSSVLAATGPATPDSTTDAAFPITVPAAQLTTAANFTITEKDPAGTPLSGGFKSVAIQTTYGTIGGLTGVGLNNGTGSSYVTATPTGALGFTLTADGRSGTSTVTISVNGVAVKSYVVTFSGAATKIVLTAINPVVAKGTVAGVTANTNAFEVQEFDAAGNAVAVNTAITLTPADKTIATAASPVITGGSLLGGRGSTAVSSTAGGSTVTGVAVGTTTFTATDGTLVSNAVSVRVSSATPTSVVFAADSAEYAAGAAGTMTTTISDADGTVPAGTYAVLTAAATSAYALTVGTLPGASVTVNNAGVLTTPFNAPIADGTNTISATGVTGVTVTPATFNVTSGGSAAANAASDAAAEATDAANAATDAANAAADSADQATAAAQDAGDKADAALAAVMALSQQVTDLLDKINALSDANAQLTESLAMQSDALAAQTKVLASQAKTVAAQTKALAAQKALVARLVRKAKA